MTRSIKFLARFTSMAALSLLTVTAAHGDPQSRPFKATLTTQETLTPDPERCPLSILKGTTVGQGVASHLGTVTFSSTDCPVLGVTQFTFTDGKLVLVAANGDILRADYSGSLSPGADYPVFTLSGTYRVTGGTGRFSNASGVGVLQGTTNIATGKGGYEVSGTLGY